jgi:hypothetical protein
MCDTGHSLSLMNPMAIKTLIQAKEDRLSVSILITEEFVKTLLTVLQDTADQRATVTAKFGTADIMLEIYRPGQSTNLGYTKNLERTDWEPIHITLL